MVSSKWDSSNLQMIWLVMGHMIANPAF